MPAVDRESVHAYGEPFSTLWKVRSGGQFHVELYGAVGDGIADDTAALQAAVTDALAVGGLVVLSGRHKVTSTVTGTVTDATKWSGSFGVVGRGMGFARDGSRYGSVIEPTNAVTGPALYLTGLANTDNSNAGQLNGLVLRDFGVRGVEGGTNGNGIQLKFWTNATLRNLLVTACANGIVGLRQANGATFGYGNGTRLENVFVAICRQWGVNFADEAAIIADIQGCNFAVNTLGGVKMCPGPASLGASIFTGNTGPALQVVKSTGVSNATGPTITGCHFESNGAVPAGSYATDDAQIVIDYAQGPTIIGSTFLGSTSGQHSVKAGYGADTVNGLVMKGNRHFGKTSVSAQRAFLLGDNCVRAQIDDKEVSGFGGSSARATSSQAFGGQTGAGTAGLGPGTTIDGAQTFSNGVAASVLANADLPPGCRGLFEVSSQGGAVYATGMVKRGRDGTAISVMPIAASADCSLSIVSNSLRVTQTNTGSLAMYWSLLIQQTV